jgi:hypothetical protein
MFTANYHHSQSPCDEDFSVIREAPLDGPKGIFEALREEVS